MERYILSLDSDMPWAAVSDCFKKEGRGSREISRQLIAHTVLAKDLGSVPPYAPDISQALVTLVPENQTPLSGFQECLRIHALVNMDLSIKQQGSEPLQFLPLYFRCHDGHYASNCVSK